MESVSQPIYQSNTVSPPQSVARQPYVSPDSEVSAKNVQSGDLQVHFLDVGQADCALLETDGHFMMIDAGNNADADFIVEYLKNEGVEKLDYLIGTHPHEDHIGSLDTVIDSFDIGTVLMPKKSHNTKTFEDVLVSAKEKNLKIQSPKPGQILYFDDLAIEVLAPIYDYDDLNNCSIVLRVIDGDIEFLFTGDIESKVEADILSRKKDIEADVLKVAHHGSSSSSIHNFIDAVDPEFAIISVGKDNSYDHPAESTVNTLLHSGADIYRTDENGTVIVSTDGETIKIETEKEKENSSKLSVPQNKTDTQFIGNKNTKKLHKTNCATLPAEQNRIYFKKENEALGIGYKPCSKCFP